ncbi:MAG: hypothetical protein J0M28_05740 [Thauera sp.]|nr:hypothetical protein [Thauera sp.]
MRKYIIACVLLSMGAGANAALPYSPTDVELATLPPFCKARIKEGLSKAEKVALSGNIGESNFLHIHHYCIAANFMKNRLRLVSTPQEREHMLREIVANYAYVLEHGEKTFWMRPQIHVEMASALLMLKQKAEAISQYSQAIAFNPAYQPAYMPLITAYRELGNTSTALEVATAGLRQFPGSKPLQEAYLSAGGKKPFPEPAANVVPEVKPKLESPPSKATDTQSPEPVAGPAGGAAVPTSGSASEPEVVSERGCRFCPPEEIQKKWRESFGEQPKQ